MQIFLLEDALLHIAHVLDVVFHGNPTGQLYFVMIACPLAMNVLQVRFPPALAFLLCPCTCLPLDRADLRDDHMHE